MKRALLIALAASSLLPTLGAAQPVLNFGPGQTITNTTAIPSGAIVNLNGGAVANGVVLPNGTTVNVNGGTIGLGVDLTNGVLNINAGSVAVGASSIGTGFTNNGNTINLNGGNVGGFFQVSNNSTFTISGGTIESFGPAVFGGPAEVTITGGAVTRFPDIFSDGSVDLFGGDVFAARVFSSGTLNVFGSALTLGGAPIPGLTSVGDSITITTRDETLAATLADGSPFETDLNTSFGDFFSDNPDGAADGATITATLTAINGDANADGAVNAADFVAFRDTLGDGVDTPFAGADNTGDQLVTTADLEVFLSRFGATGGPTAASTDLAAFAIPEPTGAALAALVLLVPLLNRQRS